MRPLAKLSVVVLFGILSHPAYAGDITPPAAVKPAGTITVVASGAAQLFDAHVTENLVVYGLNRSVSDCRIHYVNLADGSDVVIPDPDGTTDMQPEVSGNTIVFTRTINYGNRAIYAYDVTSKTTTAVTWDQMRATEQTFPSIGGRTIAWQEDFDASQGGEIVVFDLDSSTATRLTTDTVNDRWPRVSPDGSTVVWTKAIDSTENQLWQATKNPDGTWTSKQLTTGVAPYPGIDTDGTLVAYATIRNGDFYQSDLRFQPVGGGTETRVVIPGSQWSHEMSNRLVVFAAAAEAYSNSDIYAYDIDSNVLYQITDTPDRSEDWDDVWVDADGTAHVVYTVATTDNYEVVEFSFHLDRRYTVQPLFDQNHAHKFRAVVPLKLELLDAQGNNVSSPDITVAATDVVLVGGETPSEVVEAGNADPDTNFRYDATLGGYVFNLSSKNLAPGTWELHFLVGSDKSPYSIRFSLR